MRRPPHQQRHASSRARHGSIFADVVDVLGQLSNLKNLADGLSFGSPIDLKTTLYVQNQRRLKQDQIDALIKAYRNGAGTTQLSRYFGIHRTTVWKHLERAGVPRRPAKRKLTNAQVRAAAARYSLGLSVAVVANESGVSAETLRKEFIRAGVKRR